MASACGVLRARYERRLVVTPRAGKTVGVSHARRCRSCVVRYRGEGKVDAVVSATASVHRRLPAAPPRRALGVEASARGLVRGRPPRRRRGSEKIELHQDLPKAPQSGQGDCEYQEGHRGQALIDCIGYPTNPFCLDSNNDVRCRMRAPVRRKIKDTINVISLRLDMSEEKATLLCGCLIFEQAEHFFSSVFRFR